MAYATSTDLYAVGIQAAAVAGVPTDSITEALETASSLADGYIRSKEPVPLASPYPPELTLAVVKIATYNILCARGFRPDGGDEIFKDRHDEAMRWLRDISAGIVTLSVANAQPNAATYFSPNVSTSTRRGW